MAAGSFAIQTTYQVKPLLGQPGMLASGQDAKYIDSLYVGNVALSPGMGVVLASTGIVTLTPSNPVTGAEAKLLLGMVTMPQGSIATNTTPPFVPVGSNVDGRVVFAAGTPLQIATTGYFFAMATATVNKDQLAAYDPTSGGWIVDPNAANSTINWNTAQFQTSGVAGQVVVIRLSGRIG